MKKSRLTNLNDALALLIRRRYWIIIPTLAFCGLAALFASFFPSFYISRTMILIESRDVPTDFVKDLIGDSTDKRLSTIQQTILSRTNLLKILGEFSGQLPEYRSLNDERKVIKLARRIKIEFPSKKVRGTFLPTTSILISYRDRSPELAQKITARIASLFIEQDNRARENKVFGTAEFFENELQKVADQLQQSDETLTKLKRRYRFEMPSERDTNLRTLDRLQIQKNGNQEALDRFVTMEMDLERRISETPPTIPRSLSGTPQTPGINPLVQTYLEKKQEFKELSVKAKPTHPDMRRLKAELEQLEKEIPPEDLLLAGGKDDSGDALPDQVPNPVHQSLISQLNQLKTDIAIREREREWIEQEMAKYNRRVENTPRVEQEMLAITRAHEDLLEQHAGLKTKLEEARLAGSLESRQKGEQFSIIDPANYPLESSSPSPIKILLIGFGMSLGAGVALAVLVDLLNPRVLTHQELERALEAPVLVEIPSMVTSTDIRKARRKIWLYAFVGTVGTAVYTCGIYYLYLKQGTVLGYLDPVIEKIMERAAN